MFNEGQTVWCLIYGQGVVTDVDSERTEETYSVFVKFQNYDELHISYTMEGKFHNQGNITLFPYPVEVIKALTKPSIDWSHVSSEYNYLVQDSDGEGYLCGEEPSRVKSGWNARSPYISAMAFSSYVPGTCDWQDSLVKRPEGDNHGG